MQDHEYYSELAKDVEEPWVQAFADCLINAFENKKRDEQQDRDKASTGRGKRDS